MPQYEYRCPDCEVTFETYARMKDSQQEQPCPECGSQSRRFYSRAPSFIMRPVGYNLRPGDEGYDSMFEKRSFTRAQHE